MLTAVRRNEPSADTVNQVMIGKQLVTRHALAAVEFALELAGGAGFYRSAGLERNPSARAAGPGCRISGDLISTMRFHAPPTS
jgi:hypothetical protein